MGSNEGILLAYCGVPSMLIWAVMRAFCWHIVDVNMGSNEGILWYVNMGSNEGIFLAYCGVPSTLIWAVMRAFCGVPSTSVMRAFCWHIVESLVR